MIIKKITHALLAIVIWVLIVVYMNIYTSIVLPALSELFNSHYLITLVVQLLLHFTIQVSIIFVVTMFFLKIMKVTLRYFSITILFMYLLFFIYAPQSLYLFVWTGNWGGFIFGEHSAIPQWLSAFYITAQYSVIIFITMIVNNKKNKLDNKSGDNSKHSGGDNFPHF